MFRFFNSGLKQSVTTFPNSIYHSHLHKKVIDDEKETQKLPFVFQPKSDQTVSIYRSLSENQKTNLENYYSWERRNIIVDFAHVLQLFKFISFGFRSVADSFIPKLNDDKPIIPMLSIEARDTANNRYSDKITIEESCRLANVIEFGDKWNDKVKCDIRLSPDKVVGKEKDNNSDLSNSSYEKPSGEGNVELNELGHQLNNKGCNAAAIANLSTAVQYWNCASILNYPPAQFNLAVYYESRGDLVNAEKWYRLAITNGDHATAAYNLALLLNNKSDDGLRDEIKCLMTLSATHGSMEAMHCIDCINRQTP